MALLRLFLERSKNVPLAILQVLNSVGDGIQTPAMRTILAQTHRWRHISFDPLAADGVALLSSVFDGGLASLERITFKPSRHSVVGISALGACPHLRAVEVDGPISLEDIPRLPKQQMI
ncbi:hypothetical protein DFH09DRAFT_1080988 [Mycena vulgaris]|nr:hypothetical protein DFH09DRAFT_1080988 [Mycena vulgaris]